MRAEITTLKALFQKGVRYVIPTFQRPYVWNQDDQWEPLWNDVSNTAEGFLEELDRRGKENRAAAEEHTDPHFLGAVVLQQQPTAAPELEMRQVIDGQQRLTSLQLLLDAAQDVFEGDGYPTEARQLRRVVLNDKDYAEKDLDNVFKVWPTLMDQQAFRHAMSNDLLVDGFEDSPIVQAHEFFKLQIRQWLGSDPQSAAERAAALVTALLGLLQIVVIDLQSTDDANIIFETLNARGTPLLASDLIKNSVLHTAEQSGLKSDTVYRDHWQAFDHAWWREEVRQGRITRPRIDVYLNYWLTMRTAEEVQAKDVFRKFRDYSEPQAIVKVVEDIQAVAESFERLEDTNSSAPEALFLYRWRVMEAGATTPVILWLISNRTAMAPGHLAEALASIESYLIRRMICRLTTKDYNKLFLELMRNLAGDDPASAPVQVTNFFSAQAADARVWPTDAQVSEALLTLPLYRLLTRGRLRIVLEGIEDSLRSPKAEEACPKSSLTIEHAMPQAWRSHWPLSEDNSEQAAPARDRILHTIGNLTLVNDKLNPALSNGPWATKREELRKHSVLHLNSELLEQGSDGWDEEHIGQRGRKLAALAAKVWPRPAQR